MYMNNQVFKIQLAIACLFAIVIILEFTTPSAYVFGYLYTGPIILANSQLNRSTTLKITLLALGLTLLNLFLPIEKEIEFATMANRIIAVIALAVTAWLSDRNRCNEEAIAQTKIQLQAKEKLSQMREDFISTLTHDLKTPLLGAIETINSLQQEQFGTVNTSQKKVLEIMAKSHHTSLQLVETLLDVYRNDTEGLKLELKPVDLVAIASEAIATLTNLASSRRVYLCLNYGNSDFPRCVWVNGDNLQLLRVFINLLTNGINHSPRGDKVEIIIESYPHSHVIKIIDSGSGITPDELPYIFERFYQGHSHRQAKGSGLGLYLSRQIIAAHGGKIWAENRSPIGAIFAFRLPNCPIPQYQIQ